MRAWTWKHWTTVVATVALVAALTYWAAAAARGPDGGPVIAEPSPGGTTATEPVASPATSERPTSGAPIPAPAGEQPAAPVPSDAPTAEPARGPATESAQGPAAATWLVATDGDDVVLRSVTGGDAVALYASPDGAETSVEHVAVRPGSTPEDLTVVFTRSGRDAHDLWYATIRGRGQPTARAFPDAYQVSPGADPASHPFPVWSPDGRHLAWTELPADGGPVGLRTIGWSDGPGTGDDATDDAAFALDGLPRVPATVEEWVWHGTGTATSGSLVVTTDGAGAHRVDIERQADGALALPPDGTRAIAHPDGALIDQADGRTGPTPDTSALYTLMAAGGGEGTVDLRLTVVEASDQSDELAVPAELERTSDPGSRWMVAHGGTVLIGDGGGAAWLVHRDGEVEALPGTIRSADLVG